MYSSPNLSIFLELIAGSGICNYRDSHSCIVKTVYTKGYYKLSRYCFSRHCFSRQPPYFKSLHLGSGVAGRTMAEHGDLTDECKDAEEGRDAEEHEECNGDVIVSHVLLVFVVFKLGPSESNNVKDRDQQRNGENNGSADNRSNVVCELNIT
jgi:hypothetical protein